MPQHPTGYSEIRPEDLKTVPLYRLNSVLSFVWGKVSALFGQGKVRLNSDATFNSVAAATSILPDADGGASLGAPALRFGNLLIKNAIGIGSPAAPAYPLDIRVSPDTIKNPQVHIADGDNDDGAWMSYVTSQGLYLSQGCIYNGTNWVAKNAAAAKILALSPSQLFWLSYDTSLTVGVTFSPGQIFTVQLSSAPPICVINGSFNSAGGTYKANNVSGVTATATLFGPNTNGAITVSSGIVTGLSSAT